MNPEEFVKQDEETRQWLHDIESFRSPPPPRKLTASNEYREDSLGAFSQSLANGDASDSRDGRDFINKVKQFQLSDSHPYANKSRVETAKKIAAQGGTRGGLTAMTAEDKNKKVITKDQVNQLREHVRKESRPLNPYPSPYSDLEQGKKQETKDVGSEYSSSAYSSCSSAIDRTDRRNNGTNGNAFPIADERSKSVGGSSPSYSQSSSINLQLREDPKQLYQKSNNNVRNAEESFNKEPYRRIVLPTKDNLFLDQIHHQGSSIVQPISTRPLVGETMDRVVDVYSNSTAATNYLKQIDKPQVSNVLDDRELSAAFEDFDKDFNDLSNRSISPSLKRSPVNLNHNYANAAVRAPPPPYQRSSVTRLPSPSIVNHYRQSSSPISAPSPPVRQTNRYINNIAPIRTRSQSMQDVPSDKNFSMSRTNNINYERAISGRDIIVDRIPSNVVNRLDNGIERSVRKSESFNDSLSPDASHVAHGHFTKAFLTTSSSGGDKVSGSQDSIRISPADALEQQQQRFMQLEAQVEQELQSNSVAYGVCHHCEEKVTNPAEATQALGHLYHARCFTCCSCGRALKGKKFYDVRGRVYCEEDYLFSGFQQSAERCGICGHLIMDMILQAVGKSFHPGCFRCLCCKESLDGVPFTMDDEGRVYCINDYHRLFAPKCAKCFKPITPSIGRDETVRVVAMQKNYHVDCYICEGCGLQLTDEPEKRCYPLGEHLLCHRCHIHWSRTGGAIHPITDL